MTASNDYRQQDHPTPSRQKLTNKLQRRSTNGEADKLPVEAEETKKTNPEIVIAKRLP